MSDLWEDDPSEAWGEPFDDQGAAMTDSTPDANKNIKVNRDGTISPIDPSKPSSFTTLTPSDNTPDALDELLKQIYGKDVLDNAYASKAGRITKSGAKTALLALIEKREAVARIDEVLKMRAAGEKYATSNDASFEGLSGAYDAHILKRAADLTESGDGI